MRKTALALFVCAAVLVPLTAAPVRRAAPEPAPLVEGRRFDIKVEITFAPAPEPTPRIDLVRQLFRLTNEARADAGLRPLQWWRAAVEPAARPQTDRMVEARKIFHNPALDTLLYSLDAQTIAENVGMGVSIKGLHRAFMKSKKHRENILDPIFTLGAIWAVQDIDGVIFVTVVFGRPVPAVKRAA